MTGASPSEAEAVTRRTLFAVGAAALAAGLIAVSTPAAGDQLETRARAWCDEFGDLGGYFWVAPEHRLGVVWPSTSFREEPRLQRLWDAFHPHSDLRPAIGVVAKRRLGMV